MTSELLQILQELITSASDWFISNGLWVVFLMVFLEQFLVLSAFSQGFYSIILLSFFAYGGHFTLFEVALVSAMASAIGTHMQFYLARRYGEYLLRLFNRLPRLLDIEVLEQIEVHSGVIIISYIASHLRGPVAFIAGTSRTKWSFWCIYSSIGIVIWVGLSIAIGWGAASFFDGDLNQALLWVWDFNQNILGWVFLSITVIVVLLFVRSRRKGDSH